MKFPEQVKYARKALNLSQQQLADALGVSFATVNRWENYQSEPSKLASKAFVDFCDNNFIEFPDSQQ